MLPLIAITFVAAVINGALGYGFSSITVPLALLYVGQRALNPVLVLLEVVMNGFVLFTHRRSVARAGRRAMIVIAALPLGIAAGTALLTRIDAEWLKLATFITLLPLILLQAAGYRRAFRAERTAGAALGGGVGLLYAVTTISGPPLAMFLTNQGFAKEEFRAALSLIRVAAAILATTLYVGADLVTPSTFTLALTILPGVVIGLGVGARLMRYVREESFRRLCMTFDAAIVAWGASALLKALGVVEGPGAFALFAAVLAFDAIVLYRHFRASGPGDVTVATVAPTLPVAAGRAGVSDA